VKNQRRIIIINFLDDIMLPIMSYEKNVNSGNCCNWSSGSFTCLPPPKSPRLVASCQRKSTADSQQLQNDLRRLLNADSKENLFEATSVSIHYY
jgi:hypothetical protein